MRQTTIRGLQNCYNKKCVGISTANKTTKIIEEVISFVNFLAPEFLKKTVEVIKNSFQKKFSDRHVDEFKELLVNDEENLLLLNKDIIDKIYNPLSKLGLKFRLENDEPILFNGRYKIFEIENDIWENRPFSTLEEMERVIILLRKNLNKLKKELEQEKKWFEEFELTLKENVVKNLTSNKEEKTFREKLSM